MTYEILPYNFSSTVKHLSLVDMVVGTRVRTTHGHDRKVRTGMQTEVVHWRLQKLSIILEPIRKVEGGREGHFHDGALEA